MTLERADYPEEMPLQELVSQARQRTTHAIEIGEAIIEGLERTIEESDRRVEPAIQRLRAKGLLE